MIFFLICAIAASAGLFACGIQAAAVRSTLRRTGGSPGPESVAGLTATSRSDAFLPPISILKPLSGLDDNLFDNLASFCNQDYPEYEVLFCLQDFNDPACKVAKKVMDRYPGRNITMVVERCNPGLNPKVNNLVPGYRRARYEQVLISDSNVLVDKSYLREIVQHMKDPAVGLVSNLIRGVGGRSLGAVLENLHLNSFIMSSVCFLDKVMHMPCVIGKSMLMRKADLEALGGLTAFKDVLAEDFIIGRSMAERGRKVVLSIHVIKNVNEHWDLKRFLNRHTRWGKLRWKIGGYRYLSELLANPLFIASLPVLLWQASGLTLTFAGFVGLVKTAGDYLVGEKISGRSGSEVAEPLSGLRYLLMPVKDLLIGAIWFIPLLSNIVVWRGNRYTIGKDSVLSPCPEPGSRSWPLRIAHGIRHRLAQAV